MPSSEISPLSVSEEFLLEKCDFFVDAQLWPLRSRLDPRDWLSNFLPSEKEHALSLLSAFQYFSERLIDELFVAGFQNLSCHVTNPADQFSSTRQAWTAFIESAIVTHVEGEAPHSTDSGYIFVRRARQLLRLDVSQILSPGEALKEILLAPNRPVIFVDDFVGTGRQFEYTWYRQRPISPTKYFSFKEAMARRPYSIIYVPLLATAAGLERLRSKCQGVTVLPVHVISDRYGAFAENSYIWPPQLRASAHDFLLAASRRAGIADDRWRGLDGLGLVLAFSNTVPDSTLPIIYWEQNGWKPLIRRS